MRIILCVWNPYETPTKVGYLSNAVTIATEFALEHKNESTVTLDRHRNDGTLIRSTKVAVIRENKFNKFGKPE